jgi:hypothetical protein
MPAKPTGELTHHLLFVIAQLVEIYGGLSKRDTMGGKIFGLIHHRGNMQKRFRRNAAHIETDAPEGG